MVTFIDVSANAIWHENKAARANAETGMCRSVIDTLLVFGAWIGGGAIVRSENTEEAPLLEWPWTTTVLAKALQISWALMVMYAASGNGALNVRVSAQPTGTCTLGSVVEA